MDRAKLAATEATAERIVDAENEISFANTILSDPAATPEQKSVAKAALANAQKQHDDAMAEKKADAEAILADPTASEEQKANAEHAKQEANEALESAATQTATSPAAEPISTAPQAKSGCCTVS